MKTTCHFEFWGAIRTREQLDTFFSYTDPELVFFFCDTAQHTIAGVDPIQLFRDYKDRCTGFHFKDTRNVDEDGSYRTPPDAELMAPDVRRWFYEMGTEGGLVDFPALIKEIVSSRLRRAGSPSSTTRRTSAVAATPRRPRLPSGTSTTSWPRHAEAEVAAR